MTLLSLQPRYRVHITVDGCTVETSSKGRLGPVDVISPPCRLLPDRKGPTTDSHQREADRVAVDEVARQRQKRRSAWRDQLVGGTATVTVGQLADQAADATGADVDAVTRFLRGGGHSPATIENVIRCLGLDGTTEPDEEGTVQALVHASRAQERLRTVAQLEDLLLKD